MFSVTFNCNQYFTIETSLLIKRGKRPNSPYIAAVHVVFLTPRRDLQNFNWTLSKSLHFVNPHTGLQYKSIDPTNESNNCNDISGLTGLSCFRNHVNVTASIYYKLKLLSEILFL